MHGKVRMLIAYHLSELRRYRSNSAHEATCYNSHGTIYMERGSSVVEWRSRNQVRTGSNPSLLPFGRLVIFVLSIDAPVHSVV